MATSVIVAVAFVSLARTSTSDAASPRATTLRAFLGSATLAATAGVVPRALRLFLALVPVAGSLRGTPAFSSPGRAGLRAAVAEPAQADVNFQCTAHLRHAGPWRGSTALGPGGGDRDA